MRGGYLAEYRCASFHARARAPSRDPRTLTDAADAKYHCLPNHALRWLKASEATPTSKWIHGSFY